MDHVAPPFDRTQEDVGNIVEFGHVNVAVPDQRLATLFYVSGLGLTRDPFLMTGVDNMWINAGTGQFHLPLGPAQVLRGTVGLVVSDLGAAAQRLADVAGPLAGTRFRVSPGQDVIEATCPWGNRVRCHAPGSRWPGLELGIAYVEIDVPPGTAAGIARFYRETLSAPAVAEAGRARVPAGTTTNLVFVETASPLPAFDGHHIQVTLADFSGPHARLVKHGLITQESNAHQYRFENVIDIDSGAVLATVEHEVRSMRHPLYARPLLNRNAGQSPRRFSAGRETASWAAPVV